MDYILPQKRQDSHPYILSTNRKARAMNFDLILGYDGIFLQQFSNNETKVGDYLNSVFLEAQLLLNMVY